MMKLAAFLLWILVLCFPVASADAQERILNFHSLVTVSEDRSVTVKETIKVVATANRIKKGIYRSFPTHFRDRFGNRVTVSFDVLEVLRDGKPEAYHLKTDTTGVIVYMGQKSVFLDPGEYTYTLTYRTDQQINFAKEFDELYWNVTGQEWAFLMEKVSAEVRLPAGTTVLDFDAYTGRKGEYGKDYTASRDGERSVKFITTRPFVPGEELVVAVSWPKGHVKKASDDMFYAKSNEFPHPLWVNLDASLKEIRRESQISVLSFEHNKGNEGSGAIGRFILCNLTILADKRGYKFFKNSKPVGNNMLVVFMNNKDEKISDVIKDNYSEYTLLDKADINIMREICGL